jgi:adenylylsulfate kinase-like enzyme
MADAELVMAAALMWPLQAEREAARAWLLLDHFIEIFLDTPLGVCEIRDTKGLYKRARSGKIPNFTGIDSVYKPSMEPDLRTDSVRL